MTTTSILGHPAMRIPGRRGAAAWLRLPRWPLGARPGGAPIGGPAGEGAWARAIRWIEDRRRLAALDERLLRDIGLTPEDVAREVPFRRPGQAAEGRAPTGRCR